MANQKPRDDLSTEQIMASIGRIVAEGEGGAPASGGDPAPTRASAPGESEDVLDLVDAVDEQGNVVPMEQAPGGLPTRRAARPAPASARGDRTAEDLVVEALRPLFRAWLDTHMPQIVERVVQRELERTGRRSEPE